MSSTAIAASRTEGYVDIGPGRVWYEMAGEGERTLLLLHGGPGADSTYLEAFMVLADEGFRVARFDQLGSTKSDKPDDRSLWQVPRFVAEVETVRRALDLGRMHLLGQSWGSFLALEYALHHQEHLRSLILYSGAASTEECYAGMLALRARLRPEEQQILARHEESGETEHPDYMEVMEILYRRHLCRVWPYPPALQTSMDSMAAPVYNTMWGPNEFTCTGNLMGWDRSDRLGEIAVPTLITVGRHDEVVPSCAETMHRGILGSQLEIFEESAHLAHLEEPDRYFSVLRAFLARADARSERETSAE